MVFFAFDIHFAIGASIIAIIGTSSGAASTYVKDKLTNLRDAVIEADEQFTITLGEVTDTGAVQDAAITTGAGGTGTISNDDSVTLAISSPTALEGTGAGTTTLTFNVTSGAAVQVYQSNPASVDR